MQANSARSLRPLRVFGSVRFDSPVKILAAFFEDLLYLRSDPLFLRFFLRRRRQAVVAAGITLDQALFDHARQEAVRPERVFAGPPFAGRAPGDFLGGKELARPRHQEVANLLLVGIHKSSGNERRRTARAVRPHSTGAPP